MPWVLLLFLYVLLPALRGAHAAARACRRRSILWLVGFLVLFGTPGRVVGLAVAAWFTRTGLLQPRKPHGIGVSAIN